MKRSTQRTSNIRRLKITSGYNACMRDSLFYHENLLTRVSHIIIVIVLVIDIVRIYILQQIKV